MRKILVTLVLLAGVVAVTEAPAYAFYETTFYDGQQWTGSMLNLNLSACDGVPHNFSALWRGRISSVGPVGPCNLRLYTGANGTGSVVFLGAGSAGLASMPGGFDNSVISWKATNP